MGVTETRRFAGRQQFARDDTWQRDIRDRFLAPLYDTWIARSEPEKQLGDAYTGKYIFLDRGACMAAIQRTIGVDTILDLGARQYGIEEKIVRWPEDDQAHTGFTFETWSNTGKGREKPGWLMYSAADMLVYGFMQRGEMAMNVYVMPMQSLRRWLLGKRPPPRPRGVPETPLEEYPTTITDQINRTECRIVDISHVLGNVPASQFWEVRFPSARERAIVKRWKPPE